MVTHLTPLGVTTVKILIFFSQVVAPRIYTSPPNMKLLPTDSTGVVHGLGEALKIIGERGPEKSK